MPTIYHSQSRFYQVESLEVGRRRARYQWTPLPGYRMPLWACTWLKVQNERCPTNWGLPRARMPEAPCAGRGADACRWEWPWKNPSLGPHFWLPILAGAAGSTALGVVDAVAGGDWLLAMATPLPLVAGTALGYSLREGRRRRHVQRLLDIQSEEIIYSNRELEKKFAELETRIEQLSLLTDLSAAVSATLDPEKISDQTLTRLVHRMAYQRAQLLLVDRPRRVLRGHRIAGAEPGGTPFEGIELPLDADASASGRAAVTGEAVLVNDVEQTPGPIHQDLVQAHQGRSFVATPLRGRDPGPRVPQVTAAEPNRFHQGDVDLLAAVANQVALAIDKAESFQTIEELSRSLEDKVRVRTEQLRVTNEELRGAYRDLQATQLQLIQREKMASVGQLVAGGAHGRNNPAGRVRPPDGPLPPL